MTTASALTLNSGATLTFDMTGVVANRPIINIQAGALALTDANCTLTSTTMVNWKHPTTSWPSGLRREA